MDFKANKASSLADFLIESLSSKSKTKVRNMVKSGRVSVNDRQIKKPDQILKPGDKIRIMDINNTGNKLINILFEDKYLLVAEKPSGLLSISTERENKNTFYRFISSHVKENSNNRERIFIVHRLDREVSGIMVFAKDERTKTMLQEDWNNTRKEYFAVVEGVPPQKEGKLENWLKENKSHIVYISSEEDEGYFSVTNYKLIAAGKNYSLLELSIETGRKHQIRVQLSNFGFPVAGDVKYGAKTNPVRRICLHSGLLSFKHPVTDKIMTFRSEIPQKIYSLLKTRTVPE